MTHSTTPGTATYTLATWQVKAAQRLAQLPPGRYMIVFDMPAGTVEPDWSVMGYGKVENGR